MADENNEMKEEQEQLAPFDPTKKKKKKKKKVVIQDPETDLAESSQTEKSDSLPGNDGLESSFAGLKKKKKKPVETSSLNDEIADAGEHLNESNKSKLAEAVKDPATTLMDLPNCLMVETLLRLPLKSLMILKCVSKSFSSLITSRHFTNVFFNFSPLKNRAHVYTNGHRLFSSWPDPTASFPQLKGEPSPLPGSTDRFFVNSLRGLMCYMLRTEIRIVNFTTRQVVNLPPVEPNTFEASYSTHAWAYFGHDDPTDEYKVLSTIYFFEEKRTVKSETKVLVLGPGATWRNPKSLSSPPPTHRPLFEAITINGIVYYAAMSHEDTCVVMSFDLNTEEFNLIEVPDGALRKNELGKKRGRTFWEHNLTKYQDKVAVINCTRFKTEGIVDLWVAEDVRNGIWANKQFVLPYDELKASLNNDDVKICGTNRNGEVMLCPRWGSIAEITRAYYDLEKQRITRGFVLQASSRALKQLQRRNFGFGKYRLFCTSETMQKNVWDYDESIMYLEI